jgi:hypothetical protein
MACACACAWLSKWLPEYKCPNGPRNQRPFREDSLGHILGRILGHSLGHTSSGSPLCYQQAFTVPAPCADRSSDASGVARDQDSVKEDTCLFKSRRDNAGDLRRLFRVLVDVLRLVLVKIPNFLFYVLWRHSTWCLGALYPTPLLETL